MCFFDAGAYLATDANINLQPLDEISGLRMPALKSHRTASSPTRCQITTPATALLFLACPV